jgi:hypothetical protein
MHHKMILKIEAKFKGFQLIDLPVTTTRDVVEVQVNKKGIDVICKDGEIHTFPIEIETDPINATWEVVRNYKPLDDEIIEKKPKKKSKPKHKKVPVDLPCIEFEVPRGNAKIDEDPFD